MTALPRMPRIFCLAAAVSIADAQAPPADLMATMQTIAKALGVSCNYCHTAERGSGQPEPKKEIARAMMAMTRDINAKITAATGQPEPGAARVECVTCHRGVAIPQQLTDVITRTLREKGVAAAAAQYRDLHQQYYGRATYDFSDDTLLSIAQRLSASRPDDAIALLQVNLEFNPQSARTYAAIAYAYTRKLDDATAMTNLEKALEIEPENGVIRGQLEQLKSYHRRK
ncbi:MAG TPA: photosynthetic reaction center cytochrome c subunit family protein [Bryobacteraceae bacterium]|jgi:tetratricopeptide (TPR) repeat protein|nr:photosynthetic reaction center cytochrome c subunit family protein [Bryobacteraceae bacterium]